MSRYAQIQDGKVVNVVEWNGNVATWPPGASCVRSDVARIGDTYDGATFTTPVSVDSPPRKSDVDQLIDFLVTENVITAQKATAHRTSRK